MSNEISMAIYDESTGMIRSIAQTYIGADLDAWLNEGEDYKLITESDGNIRDSTHYVDIGEEGLPFRGKMPQEYTLDVNGLVATFTGLAPGTMVDFIFGEIAADDEPTVIEFEMPIAVPFWIHGSAHYFNEFVEVDFSG